MRTVLKPFGSLKLTVNAKEVEYAIIPLKTTGEATGYSVDFRGKILLALPPSLSDTAVTCTIENETHHDLQGGSDTGEDLSAITFDWNDHRLTIGTVGDLPDRTSIYMKNGLKVILRPCAQMREISFCVAEKKLNGQAACVDTWLAADIKMR